MAIYGSVALYKKDANPFHWFNKAETTTDDNIQNNQASGSMDAGNPMTKDQAMREVSVWLITGNLDNVPSDAIKFIDEHQDGTSTLADLSQKVREKMQQLEKERSSESVQT